MDKQTVVSSAIAVIGVIISALIAALVARRNSERAIQIENITKERAKWRDKIREQALEVHRATTEKNHEKLMELRLALSLNLNPEDKEDRAILDLISEMVRHDKGLEEFSVRVALLLKHDWERAKREAKPFSLRWLRHSREIDPLCFPRIDPSSWVTDFFRRL